MAIIKYSLDNGRIPGYISDGGYFLNSSALAANGTVTYTGDSTRIGIGSGGGTELTKSQLISHVLAVHAGNPWVKSESLHNDATPTGVAWTNAEMTTQVNAWCTLKGVS